VSRRVADNIWSVVSGVARGGHVMASGPGRQGSGAPNWGLKSLLILFCSIMLYFCV